MARFGEYEARRLVEATWITRQDDKPNGLHPTLERTEDGVSVPKLFKLILEVELLCHLRS